MNVKIKLKIFITIASIYMTHFLLIFLDMLFDLKIFFHKFPDISIPISLSIVYTVGMCFGVSLSDKLIGLCNLEKNSIKWSIALQWIAVLLSSTFLALIFLFMAVQLLIRLN